LPRRSDMNRVKMFETRAIDLSSSAAAAGCGRRCRIDARKRNFGGW
jgi:hypothetical protein